MKAALRKFFGWLNRKLNIVETDPEKNAYYDAVDRELDYQEWYERYWKDEDFSTDAKAWRGNSD